MLGRLWIQIAAEEGAREGGRGREAGRGRETEREEGEVVIRRAGGLHFLPRLMLQPPSSCIQNLRKIKLYSDIKGKLQFFH